MMVPLILLVLVHSSLSLGTSRAYHYVNLMKTWSEARAYCRENFVDLATMETEEDWAMVRELVIANSGGELVWMGLYDDLDGWRWSMDGASLNYADISLSKAFNTHKSEMHCVSLFKGGLLDNQCDSAFYSVCYDETSGSYIPVRLAMTWEDAQSYCRGTHTDLTSLRGLEEVQRVSSVVDTESNWWIGLSRGPRQWSDGSNSSLRLWDGGQPFDDPQDCGCLLVGGWHDCGCLWLKPFICSVPIRTVLKIEMRTDRSMDLNDARIRDSIGMQVEEYLQDQGLHHQVRLKWMKQPNGEFLSKNVTQL